MILKIDSSDWTADANNKVHFEVMWRQKSLEVTERKIDLKITSKKVRNKSVPFNGGNF